MTAQSTRAVGRRDLLKGMAAAAAVLPFAGAQRSWPASSRTAVVVGAGIAGLSAAWDLHKAGFVVSVFEKSDFAGGRMREAWMGPLWGPPHALGVLQANREMFDLAREIGIADELNSDAESESYFVDNGHGLYSRGLRFRVDEVMKVPGLSDSTRRSLPKLNSEFREIAANIDPCLLATGAGYDKESLADYFRRVLGRDEAREVLDYWVDVVLEAWGWPAETTSCVPMLAWFAQQEAKVVVPRGGIGVLTRALAARLDVQLRTAVRYITPPDASGRHMLHYLDVHQQRKSITPDVVLIATEGKYIPSLVQTLTPAQSSYFNSIDFTKGCGVSYVLDATHAPREMVEGGFTPNHPDPLKRRVAYWNAMPAMPDYHQRPPTVTVIASRKETTAWQASGQAQQDYCLPLLKSVYPQLDQAGITDAVVLGCDDLMYMPVGCVRAIAAVLREQERDRRGLYFAGEYLAGAHTGAACASGRTVARCIRRHWI